MRVSVIVPAYQAERCIGACLRALRAQTLADIEILCVDDGSADGTAKLLHEAARLDPRVRALHQLNAGVSAARNTGLERARGDYIAFADADDQLPPRALEQLWRASQSAPGMDIVTADHWALGTDGVRQVITCPRHPALEDILGALVRCDGRYNAVWGKLYRRSFLEGHALRMPESLRIGEDVLFNLRAFVAAKHWAHVPEPLYAYHLHADSAMARQGDPYAAHLPLLEAMEVFLRAQGLKTAHYRNFLELHVGLLAHKGTHKLDAAARQRINASVSPGQLPHKQRLLWAALAVGMDGPVFRQIRPGTHK